MFQKTTVTDEGQECYVRLDRTHRKVLIAGPGRRVNSWNYTVLDGPQHGRMGTSTEFFQKSEGTGKKKSAAQLDREIKQALGAKTLTRAQIDCLSDLSNQTEVWWHDLPAGTREVLLERGYIKEKRHVKCNTAGHRHPGYMEISAAGLDAL